MIEQLLSENIKLKLLRKQENKENEVFNAQVLLHRLDNDIDLIEELLSIFYNDLPAYIQKLKQALSRKDYKNAKQLAHTIKGSAVNIEALTIKNTADNIENKIENLNVEHANELINELEDEYEKFKIVTSSYFNLQ